MRRARDYDADQAGLNGMTVRVGIIGAGSVARNRHLPGLMAIPNVKVLAVCNRNRETAERVATEFDVPRVVTNWRDVVAMDDIDSVVIAAPPYLHCEATCAALEADKHVLCQARMAMNVAEARQMLAAARQIDRVATLVPSPVAISADIYIRQLLDEGYLGQPYFVNVRQLGVMYADPSTPLHWRQTPEISGANILSVGFFNEVIQRWLGDTVQVMAHGTISIPQRTDPQTGATRPVEYPDTLAISAQMANGAQAVYLFSEVAHHAGEMRIEMYGSEGTLVWDEGAGQLFGARAHDTALQPLLVPDDLWREWHVEADFIADIREGRRVSTTFDDGLKYMIFTETARQSAATGREITLAAI